MLPPPSVSVILSTYEAPDLLEKSLCGFAIQQYRGFDIVIADDGSGPGTRERIDRLREDLDLQIRHVWHEDRGFRKTAILNRAILATESEYLIFTDGDCIPRPDFVEIHLRLREANSYLVGGYFKLPRHVSESLGREAILAGRATDPDYLRSLGLPLSRKEIRLRVGPRFAPLLDRVTTTNRRWKGHNVSGWRTDLIRVNGFDERMTYGLEDVELGERLRNLGIRGRQIRHRAICVHLWHGRGYVDDAEISANRHILEETKRSGRTWTAYGLARTQAAS
ncbi:MAG: glycosyltransferase [Gemmatimonadota bacterium]